MGDVKNGEWRKLKELFSDKELVKRVLRKQKEVYTNPETLQMYEDRYDPTKPDAMSLLQALMHQLDIEIMTSCDLGDYVKDVQSFHIFKMVRQMYFDDSETCVLSGMLAKLFADYQDRVNFLCVYLAEAHPAEKWNFGPRFCFMEQHKTIDDRVQAARDLIATDSVHNTFTTSMSDSTRIPIVLDTMDENFAITYSAHPDSIIIINPDNKIVYKGGHLTKVSLVDDAREWLQQNME